MPTYQLSAYVYLNSCDECYQKIVIINEMPIGPLKSLIKTIPNKKLSPFQSHSNCCPIPPCIFGILHPQDHSKLICMKDIADLFSFLITNGYTIQYELTKIMQQSSEKIDKLICYISKN